MYYYFSSAYPAVIKLNGTYYGSIHNLIKSCNLDQPPPFVEVCPLDSRQKPTSLILDQEFLQSPPELVSVTDLQGGYLLNFNKGYYTQEFKVYAQEKFADSVITVFSENGYKLSIETKGDFYAESIAFDFSSASIERKEISNQKLVFIRLYGQSQLALVYRLGEKITKLFSREVIECSFENKLCTGEKLVDIAKHQIDTDWELKGGEFIASSKRISLSPNFKLSELSAKLIPYAFLEQFLVGGDISEYLGGSVLENKHKLSGFFESFIGIMPPPIFRDIEEIGLIYPNGKNKYKVEYFKFELSERKIINVVKS